MKFTVNVTASPARNVSGMGGRFFGPWKASPDTVRVEMTSGCVFVFRTEKLHSRRTPRCTRPKSMGSAPVQTGNTVTVGAGTEDASRITLMLFTRKLALYEAGAAAEKRTTNSIKFPGAIDAGSDGAPTLVNPVPLTVSVVRATAFVPLLRALKRRSFVSPAATLP